VPVLYGPTEAQAFHESAVNVLIEPIRKGKAFKVDDALVRFPTHVKDVGRFVEKLLSEHFRGDGRMRGVFHCSASKAYTKYEMSCCIADLLGLDKGHIESDRSALEEATLSRPVNPRLCTEYSHGLVGFETVYEFESSIKECLEEFVA